MHIVYRAANIVDATLVKDSLESEGMRAFINGEYLAGLQLLPGDLISVSVADDDVERASKIVGDIEAERMQAAPEPDDDRAASFDLKPAPI